MALEPYVFISKSTVFCPEFKKLRAHARLLYMYMIVKREGKDEWFSYSFADLRAAAAKERYPAFSIREVSDGEYDNNQN